ALIPGPWIPGIRPPYVPTRWRWVTDAELASTPQARLSQALRRLADAACQPSGDPTLAAQYADLVSLLGYLQGDVADALEAPARRPIGGYAGVRRGAAARGCGAACGAVQRGRSGA